MRVTARELARLVRGELVSGASDRFVETHASIDSRTVLPGQIFFAILGETNDGHAFISQALARGASGVVVSKDVPATGEGEAEGFVIRVEDTTLALQDLATAVREKASSMPVVAVTGSMGKTTTKDAAAAALSARHVVLKSEGNLNNHWGLPLSLLRLRDESVAVLEMGMSAPGEIARLCEIARPDVGVVTNVAEAHLEFFGTVEKIAEAKGELFFGLAPGGIAVVNADDPLVLRQAEAARETNIRRILFGLESEAAEVRASSIESSGTGVIFTAEREGESARVRSSLVGRHNVYNLLAGLAVASALDVPLDEAARAIESVGPGRHRGERLRLASGILLIDETYNSNPRALAASLDVLAAETGARRVAVVGDMLELGDQAEALHRAAGRAVGDRGIEVLVAVGALGSAVADGAIASGLRESDVFAVPDSETASEILLRELATGDVVLLKGSRGVGLDRAVDRLVASAKAEGDAAGEGGTP